MKEFSHLESKIKQISRYLTRDRELQKDLCQEMRIHLWQVEEGHTDSFYLQGAKYIALKYMRDNIVDDEVCVGGVNDLEELTAHRHSNPNFYDLWHLVDKNTERYYTGETV